MDEVDYAPDVGKPTDDRVIAASTYWEGGTITIPAPPWHFSGALIESARDIAAETES